MTIFDRLASKTDSVFLRHGGEPVIIRPMVPARGARVVAGTDPERGPDVETTGVLTLEARVAGRSPVMEAEETARRPGAQSDRWILSLPSGSLPWLPKVGDLVTRVRNGQVLKVASDAAQDETWLRITLSG
ncbi:hypothetical protein GCM10019059_07670 [Camelimonas fluminis]|uniref:Uncharacterized protein n=1 Tax=Camelimonas fluminis TaxID=1576911 RepID=A0ABV7UFB1_9HYPH|nr:hypothetical protein [Camelimonas fluminis]GHE50964.1 hypothetical protein GCM10019059_07670 [Camelimonas fluminis]